MRTTGSEHATGATGGATEGFTTCVELDALAPEPPRSAPGYDLNGDGAVDAEDLYAWFSGPIDLNADGAASVTDAALLRRAVRWGETGQITR